MTEMPDEVLNEKLQLVKLTMTPVSMSPSFSVFNRYLFGTTIGFGVVGVVVMITGQFLAGIVLVNIGIGVMVVGAITGLPVLWQIEKRKRVTAEARLTEIKTQYPPRARVIASPNDTAWRPSYPVTDGVYDPSLYMQRGGRAMGKFLKESGYGDYATYEANHPD